MLCFQFRKYLHEFIKGQLDPTQGALYGQHAQSCSSCHARLEEEKKIYANLKVAKSVSVPESYWATFWPRLRNRLENVQRKEDTTPSLWMSLPWKALAPSMAVLTLLIGYWMGHYQGMQEGGPHSGIHFASDDGQKKAEQVFQEMLELFPDRVQWISYLDGKVDFSISSEPFEKEQPLVPLVVTLARAPEPLKARFLIRVGQEVLARGSWDKEAIITLQAELNEKGKLKALCRLDNKQETASVEGAVSIKDNTPQSLGTFRWDGHPISIEIQKVAPSEQDPKMVKEPNEKVEL